MNKRRIVLLGVVLGLMLSGARADEATLAAGKESYIAYCARCHGATGKGDGSDGKRTPITPRNLTNGVYKFRTTESGTAPTDADLMWVLNHGMSGSGMPSFANLDNQVKKNIIEYIKTLSNAFEHGAGPVVPAPNTKSRIDPKKGEELFAKLQCGLCHGKEGRANGTSAFTMKDSTGNPIKPANLTEGWTYRAGHSPTDIYYRLMTGLDGAPMPAYKEAVSADDAWQLANYVASMQIPAHWSFEIDAKKLSGELPKKWDDAAWKNVPHTNVNLQSWYYKGGKRDVTTVNQVAVQMVYNDKDMAFRLSWSDPVMNDKDELAIAIRPADFKGETRANLYSLYAPNAEPLDLTVWRAAEPNVARQKISNLYAAERGLSGNTNSVTAQSDYHDGEWRVVLTRPLNLDAANVIEMKKAFRVGFAAWDANNGETDYKHTSSEWITVLGADHKPAHH